MAKQKRPRKTWKHIPNPEGRKLVTHLAMMGWTDEQIAAEMEINERTVQRHYKPELKKGRVTSNAVVMGKLFELCMEKNPAAVFFWCKTRMGMRETDNQAPRTIPQVVYFEHPAAKEAAEELRTLKAKKDDIDNAH